MKHTFSTLFGRAFTATSVPLVLAFALTLAGCATQKEVARIVADSNAAMLAGQFGLPDAHPGGQKESWETASDRIEAFIAAHPDQPATTSPLRIRQATLLLSHGQFALAEAAFNDVKLGDLHSDRDKAIKRSQKTMLWWFANSTNDIWTSTDQTQAQNALDQLKGEQALLKGSVDIRDYLAELRAWIGLSAAKQTTSEDTARTRIETTLNVYAGIFTPEDLVIIASGKENLPDPKAMGVDVRRRVRSRAVLRFARELNQDEAEPDVANRILLNAHPQNATFDAIINP